MHKARCLSNLVLRNREVPEPMIAELAERGCAAPNPLKLPFMLIRVRAAAPWGRRRGAGMVAARPQLAAPLTQPPIAATLFSFRQADQDTDVVVAACFWLTCSSHSPFTCPLQADQDADVVVDISPDQLQAHLDFQQ